MHDAIIVGAGIVGAACARSLAREGMRVLVLDAAIVGGGSTAAGMGHLVVMDDSPAQLALTALSAELWRSEHSGLPLEVEHDPCGTIWVGEDDEQMDTVADKRELYRTVGIRSEILTEYRLAELEPNLRTGLAGGLLVPGDAVIYPPRAALHLMQAAVASGAELRERTRVDEVMESGVRCGEEVHEARIVINAAGADAVHLTPELPIAPRKGHLAITDRYAGFCRHQLVELGYLRSAHEMSAESVAFNVQPRKTSQVLIGSSRELVGWDGSTNRRVLSDMLARATQFMPAISDLSIIRTWTGFRPATPDSLPIIGRLAATSNTWIAAGHEGLGISTSLGTAAVLTALIMGRKPSIDPSAFSPNRFAARQSVAA